MCNQPCPLVQAPQYQRGGKPDVSKSLARKSSIHWASCRGAALWMKRAKGELLRRCEPAFYWCESCQKSGEVGDRPGERQFNRRLIGERLTSLSRLRFAHITR